MISMGDPNASVLKDALCGGAGPRLTDRNAFEPVLTGLTIVAALHRLYPGQFEVDNVIRLLGNRSALDRLKAGGSPRKVLEAAAADVEAFVGRRRKALLYRDDAAPAVRP